MSEAQKMFKELGYEITKNDEMDITYENKTTEIIIEFHLYNSEHQSNYPVNVKEHQAIHQKMKELGWLNE